MNLNAINSQSQLTIPSVDSDFTTFSTIKKTPEKVYFSMEREKEKRREIGKKTIGDRQNEIDVETRQNIPFPMKSHYHSCIPLKIFQTWYSLDLPPVIASCVEELKEKNPEFEHILMDDEQCREFLENHYEEDVVNAFDQLIPGAYRADLWRYCILYVYGGIYLDIKYRCVNDFRLIDLTENEYFVKDMDCSGKGVYNALMVSKPKNPKYLQFINRLVQNVKDRFYGEESLSVTGPNMLKQFFSVEEIDGLRYIHKNYNNRYYIVDNEKKINILKIDNKYREEQKIYTNNKQHYCHMWYKRQIYKES
jgi:mannosyltransferase OCH1-like enzyme